MYMYIYIYSYLCGYSMPIMLNGHGYVGHLIPHMEVWIPHPMSAIPIRYMRCGISCISKGIWDIPNHIYP